MKYLMIILCLLFEISCSNDTINVNKYLDVFVGMEKTEVVKTLGYPTKIHTQYVTRYIEENDKYQDSLLL